MFSNNYKWTRGFYKDRGNCGDGVRDNRDQNDPGHENSDSNGENANYNNNINNNELLHHSK